MFHLLRVYELPQLGEQLGVALHVGLGLAVVAQLGEERRCVQRAVEELPQELLLQLEAE